MIETQNSKQYDLEDRTFRFARDCRELLRKLPRTVETIEDGKQLIRSSGSVAANYIEANESISTKDYIHRVKICRKEAKESKLWLELIIIDDNNHLGIKRKRLIREATELMRILGSIIEKCKKVKS